MIVQISNSDTGTAYAAQGVYVFLFQSTVVPMTKVSMLARQDGGTRRICHNYSLLISLASKDTRRRRG